MSETAAELRRLADLKEEEEELQEQQKEIRDNLELEKNWLSEQSLDSHDNIVKNFAKKESISLTDARKKLDVVVKRYEIEGRDIPDIVKQMRMFRRTLKGEKKIEMTKAIDNLIDGYSDHLEKSIDAIYWISKYKTAVKDMVLKESDLIKISKIDDYDTRAALVDEVCKYWEAKLFRKSTSLGPEYAQHTKQMALSKKEFKNIYKNYNTKSVKDVLSDTITKMVCESPGISSREIHDRLPDNLMRKSTAPMIANMTKKMNITNVNGQMFKLSDDIKKDIYAYTAAFIDSDGYITMDKNNNPRVGLVATGDRGKAFMLEMQKSLGGRLHLDEKSPQDTRLINRLNFYSQKDVFDLLTKCRPHFKLKAEQADILLELIKIKKGYKKESWAKPRIAELFKLMKYENHKDNRKFDWTRYDIDLDNIAKYKENTKMNLMSELDTVKKGNLDDAIDDLEEITEEYDLDEDEWSSLDDASDFLFEHKGPNKEEEE